MSINTFRVLALLPLADLVTQSLAGQIPEAVELVSVQGVGGEVLLRT